MPDPYERHARPGKHAYYGELPRGSRSQDREAAAQEIQGKPPPGKKNPDLCKTQHWKSGHTPALRVRRPVSRKSGILCYWELPCWGDSGAGWSCSHEECCSGCGKVLRTRISDRKCPQYHDITPQEQRQLDAEAVAYEERRAKWKMRRKPPVTGPQGYRKKRT